MKNCKYNLECAEGFMNLSLMENVSLEDIDLVTAKCSSEKELLSLYGINDDREVYITYNNSREKKIPIIFRNRDVFAAACFSKRDIQVSSLEEVKEFEKLINSEPSFLKFLNKNNYFNVNGFIKIDSYEKFRNFVYYYEEFEQFNRFYTFVLANTIDFANIDIKDSELANFIFSMSEQELFDLHLIGIKNDKYVSLLSKPKMHDILIKYMENHAQYHHDPTGMFSGNMVCGDTLDIQPDGTIKKKRRNKRN